jgi:NRPS condensation-like uncharacterized protein
VSETTIPERIPAPFGDIAADAMDPMMEMVLGVRLTFAERLDAEVLARATRLLLDLEPVLGCRWDETKRGTEWVRCADPDSWDVFSTVESTDPEVDASIFYATPFDPRGPRIAVRLVRSPERDELVVRFDHVAGDGWSVKEVGYLLAETYTALLADPTYVPATHAAPRPTHEDVWNALTDEQRLVAADAPKPGGSRWTMKLPRGAGRGYVERTLVLAPERVAAIRTYAHARGGTVNDALVAAMVRSAAAFSPPKRGVDPGVSISADTRRFASDPRLERIANIATTQNVVVEYVHGETFDETLAHVTAAVKPYKDCLWTVGAGLTGKPMSASAVRNMFRFMAMMMKVLHAAAIVSMNLGDLDEERLSFGMARPERAYATGPIPRFTGFGALLTYYRGAITLGMGTRREVMDPAILDRYLAGIDEQLDGALQGGPPPTATSYR